MKFLSTFFEFELHNANFKTEIIAGLTTFATMAYIIVVNPKILEVAGMPFATSMVATIVSAFFGILYYSYSSIRIWPLTHHSRDLDDVGS